MVLPQFVSAMYFQLDLSLLDSSLELFIEMVFGVIDINPDYEFKIPQQNNYFVGSCVCVNVNVCVCLCVCVCESLPPSLLLRY